MSTLFPAPAPTRSRASSTTLRPALTLKSLGRRRSNSQLQAAPCSKQAPCTDPSRPSMFLSALSTVLHWLHIQPKHVLLTDWAHPATPDPVDDEQYGLPLPASATKASFGDVFNEKPPQRHQWPSIHAPIVLVICLFPLSTLLVLLSLRTLPITFSWPRTLTDLAQLGRELHGYSQSGPGPVLHVVSILSVTAIYKHAWSIPGSVIWNVLAGALFGPAFATIMLAILTTVGSLCATMLATPLEPFIMHFFPRVLNMTRAALEGETGSPVLNVAASSGATYEAAAEGKVLSAGVKTTTTRAHASGAWVRLSVLRLIGVVPWSGINIACGVCGVPMWDCMLGSFIGTLPWTAVTCQIGDILQTVASAPSPTPQTVSSLLLSPDIIVKLVFLSFLSLAPILARDRLKALISTSLSSEPTSVPGLSESAPTSLPEKIPCAQSEQSEQDEKRVSRWTWVKEWKVRLPSRSREKSERMRQLDELVDEKQQLRLREEGMMLSS